ncbi:MAG: acetoin utilization protein AcuC [Magnetococcales bacterium]|nr:acetoin utilization protein AcuC [Magnetococcales bacterium]
MKTVVGVTIGEAIGRYGFGDHHPFGPHRMGAFWDEAQHQGLHALVTVLDPHMASHADLALFHSESHIERVRQSSLKGSGYLDAGDTPSFKGVYEAASSVVGSVLDVIDRMMKGTLRRGFVPIAGLHHARPDRAAGFCVFNDCGVAIAALKALHGLKTIAYVDIDAHHGDGVFYPFEADPDLIFADLHEDGRFLYPGTGHAHESGKGAAAGRKLNIPLPPGCRDAQFREAWPRVEELLRQHRPEFILLQCGADSISGDPITHMELSPASHGHAAKRLCELAEEFGHGRVLAVGGGGYNPANLAKAWCAVLDALCTVPSPD